MAAPELACAFRLLGPLQAPGLDRVSRPQARALLAYFLLYPNTPHTVETLASVIPPRSKVHFRNDDTVVGTAVTGCRNLLDGIGLLDKVGRGSYQLNVEEELIDRTHFDRLVEEAGRTRDRRVARDRLQRAVDLWRGDRAIPELDDFPPLMSEAQSLVEGLRSALSALFETELALLGPEGVCSRLDKAARRHPTDKRLVELAMQVNYECGNRKEAALLAKLYQRRVLDTGGLPEDAILELAAQVERKDPAAGLKSLADAGVRGPTGTRRGPWEFPEDFDDRLAGRVGPRAHLDPRLRSPESGDTSDEALASVLTGLLSWAESDELLGLFDEWDPVDPLPHPQGDAALARFRELELASEEWNYRRYTYERWEQLLVDRGDDFHAQVIHAVEALGMRECTVPRHDRYDLGIALGGARRSPLARTRWLDLLTTHYAIGAVAYATSLRPVDEEAERRHVPYARGAETEFDLMHCALEGARHLYRGVRGHEDDSESDPRDPDNWWAWSLARRYEVAPGGRPLYGFAGPSSSQKEHRPRTPDTLEFLHRKLEGSPVKLEPGARVLLVTSPIYVPYQQIEALRVLGLRHGLEVETVGHPREWTAPATQNPMENLQRVGNYLQEIRSAIEGCRRLAEEHAPG
jgi:DNA-binding SARP family transcriptional activator